MVRNPPLINTDTHLASTAYGISGQYRSSRLLKNPRVRRGGRRHAVFEVQLDLKRSVFREFGGPRAADLVHLVGSDEGEGDAEAGMPTSTSSANARITRSG